MKFFFALSEWSLKERRECWIRHLSVMLNSLAANTRVDPVMIWRGDEKHPVFRWLRERIWCVVSARPFDSIMNAPEFVANRPVEVSFATLMKLEAAYYLSDSVAIVGDVDTLWLHDPPGIALNGYIAAGGQMYPGDTRMNAGLTVIDCDRMRAFDLIGKAKGIIQDTSTGSDEFILNRLFPEPERITFEHRAFWPMPAKTPSVVHFHGPKLDQIEALGRGDGNIKKPDAEIARLYTNGRRSLETWTWMAMAYLNSPFPYYDKLKALTSI